MDLDKY